MKQDPLAPLFDHTVLCCCVVLWFETGQMDNYFEFRSGTHLSHRLLNPVGGGGVWDRCLVFGVVPPSRRSRFIVRCWGARSVVVACRRRRCVFSSAGHDDGFHSL